MSKRRLLADDELRRHLTREITSLRRYAMSLAGSINDADDLVQGTVERVLKSGLPAEAPKAWLVRVCKNLWIEEIRRRNSRGTDRLPEGTVDLISTLRTADH